MQKKTQSSQMIYIMSQSDMQAHDLHDEHVYEYVYGYGFLFSYVIIEMV